MIQLPHIAFEITDACNLNCVYCYNVWKMPAAQRVPFNSYKKATETLRRLFVQAEVQSVAFTGGEPLLAERFKETVLFVRMAGKRITLISNGNLLSPKLCAALLRIGVSLFEFPVHSQRPDIHDKMTGSVGSHEKSLAAMRAVQSGGGYVVPVVVLTKFNINHLAETLDFIHSLGCKRIMLNRYNIGGRGCAAPLDVSATAAELRTAFRIANEKAAEHGLSLTSNVCSPVCLLNPKDYPLIGFGHCSFNPLQRPVTLDINGNVRLCNHSPVVAGNIYEKNISEILFSNYSAQWETAVPAFCADCKEWNICKGGCRAASEQVFGTLHNEDPIVKELGVVN
ncbi:GeoRSP system radical SAM/SPASM protein [Bacteroidia bacterium]|nr:GeoRSP system radical SAM/SPASM protein [Bacteroidia bacterium]